jgi:hypothetical protein
VIPEFQPNGLLPQGVHWAPWGEIVQRFGTNSHRLWLLRGLERAIAAFVSANCGAIYIDGSFVTEKTLPRDYDVCWEMVGVRSAYLDPVFLDFSNRRAAQKTKYFGEFFPAHAPASMDPPLATYLNFFQVDKATGNPKGIVGLKLEPKKK